MPPLRGLGIVRFTASTTGRIRSYPAWERSKAICAGLAGLLQRDFHVHDLSGTTRANPRSRTSLGPRLCLVHGGGGIAGAHVWTTAAGRWRISARNC